MPFYEGVILVIFAVWAVNATQTASFYGESYIRLPFQDASRSTEIQLQFKSQLSYGLILLAAGSPDYVVVQLNSGLIEVRIDLGSGETVVHSQPNVRLDDLQWHTLKLKQTNSQVQLTVDDILVSVAETHGDFFELNIQYGLFLGGIGNFEEAFYGTFRNFRGCLKDVMFNGYDILHASKQLKNPLNIFEVFWDCDTIFDATSDQSINFLEETSFVAFPAMHIRKSGTFSCDFKTKVETAVVLYNSGVPPSQDYIAVEIIDGKLKLTVNKGNGPVEVISNKEVSDGKWHQMDLYITTTLLELSVDQVKTKKRFKLGDNKYINLSDLLYLGGLGFSSRGNAVRNGLEAITKPSARPGSMKGCLRNIVVNSRVYGLREVKISRAISPSCVWKYPCSAKPCIEEAECTEIGHSEYRCSCNLEVCVKPTVSTSSTLSGIPPGNILLIQPVDGPEGSKIQITTNNIEIAFEYNELRIRKSAIIFTVVVPPKHGRLEVNTARRSNSVTFTLLDLLEHKVSYLHDGTDTESDDTTIEMKIQGQHENIPNSLKSKYVFVLPIMIKARNDPPRLKLPPDETLYIVRDSFLTVRKRMLDVDDPDSMPEDLIYMVVYQDINNGFFARQSNYSQAINTFTQQEINLGKILFVHQGDLTSYLRIKVSDGTTDSSYSDLKISAKSLQLQVVKNSGIVVVHGTSQFILPGNLTTSTNVPTDDADIQYSVSRMPKYGEIQHLIHAVNKWVSVENFTQKQVDMSHIRYFHLDTDNLPSDDDFHFVAFRQEVKTREHVFHITFVRLQIEVDMKSKLVLEYVTEKTISHEDLNIITNAGSLKAKDIFVNINRASSIGNLFRKLDPSPDSKVEPLRKGDSFTKEEVDTGMILYRLNKVTYKPEKDYIDMTVSARGAPEAKFTFTVEYIPEESDIQFINNGLMGVPEGGQRVIGKDDLYVQNSDSDEFQYTVITPVKHGVLQLIDPRSAASRRTNITEFTNKQIRMGELVYEHDDSENKHDLFTFITSPIIDVSQTPPLQDQEIIKLTGSFDISITMRNDNPPQRYVDKVFQVVTNKEKIITIDDLAFADPDIDFDSSKLQYKRQRIPNGEILDARNGSEIHQFTQQDIIDGIILFKHSGKAYARSSIWVTDGQYNTPDLFEILASEPFVRVQNNTGIRAEQGKHVTLSTYNLSIETNINVPDVGINFVLSETPRHGRLLVQNFEASEFSYSDLKSGVVAYKHDGSRTREDKFSFVVDLRETEMKGIVQVDILLESQKHPPKVLHNSVLKVDEASSRTLEQQMLHVSHPDCVSSDIVYTVVEPPKHGDLKVVGASAADNIPVTFTQEDIDEGRVLYHQNLGGKLVDKFIFDVTNGYQTLHRLSFFVEIVPKNLPLQVKNFSVAEGGRFVVSQNFLHIKGKLFKNSLISYKVTGQPNSGFLQLSSDPRSSLSEFSSEQVNKEEIFYVHDDSETQSDEFTVMATTTGAEGMKKSLPATIHVNIEPVNDQPPRVTVNRGLQIWKGAMKLITKDVLSAVDLDSSPEEIRYLVTTPTNGHIAHVNNTFKSISTFTQELINNEDIAFVHSGDDTGSFKFEATDGSNKDIARSFSVVAVPLLLTMTTNILLEAYPNIVQPITNLNLFAETNDPNQTKPILYNIDTKPTHGRIITFVRDRPLEVTSFSQKEINEGKIYYQHTGYVRGWTQKDFVVLEVSTLYAEPIQQERFDIIISYTNLNTENRDQLIHMYPLQVKEGHKGRITRNNLDVTHFTRKLQSIGKRVGLEYIIKSLPRHGFLTIGDEEARISSKFSQADVNKQMIAYQHDDSDTEHDMFEMNLAITSPDEGGIGTDTSCFFNITVLPVNDQPFVLVTRSHSLQVVQGSSANITEDHLLTMDNDTRPEMIVYTVISPPDNGVLVLSDNIDEEIRNFTQEDVSSNKLLFVSDGSRKPGAFFFKVTDGAFPPYFKNFDIRVIPLKVDIGRNNPIKILQSSSSVYVTDENLDVVTNGERADVTFTVTQQPQFGKLYLGDQPVDVFTQQNLDDKQILYVQREMSSGRDWFIFSVSIADSLLVKQRINITVVPLISQNYLNAPTGSEVPITVFYLDAGELAAISGDNPTYKILQRPEFGKIAFKRRGKRSAGKTNDFEEVSTFSHEDILYGKVFYIANAKKVKKEANDSFVYLLSAYNVQPAEGVFFISVKPPAGSSSPDFVSPDGNSQVPDAGTNETREQVTPESELVSPSITSDHLLVIVFVCLIVLLIAGVFGFFLWKQKQKKQKKQDNRFKGRTKPRPLISAPLPLNQPNVHIEPSQQQSSPTSDDEPNLLFENATSNIPSITGPRIASPPRSPDLSRTEISHTVPTCKVTPLVENDDSVSTPKSPDSSAGYSANVFNFDSALKDSELLPYCNTATPVLQKNQYWV